MKDMVMNNVRKNNFLVLIKKVLRISVPLEICFSECKYKIKVLLLLNVIKPLKHVKGERRATTLVQYLPIYGR